MRARTTIRWAVEAGGLGVVVAAGLLAGALLGFIVSGCQGPAAPSSSGPVAVRNQGVRAFCATV